MFFKLVKVLITLFLFRIFSSCIVGEPRKVYFDLTDVNIENIDSRGLYLKALECDTMPRNAISFKVNFTQSNEDFASLNSKTMGFSELSAFSIAYEYISNQTVDSISITTFFDINNTYKANANVNDLFVAEQNAGSYYELYDELSPQGVVNSYLHFTPRIENLDSVCFELRAQLSDGRCLCDTTSIITIVDAK